MKIFFKLVLVSLALFSISAKGLKDVTLLEIKQDEEKFTLKLQDKEVGNDSYFFVIIDKTDKQSFAKLDYIINKIKHKDDYKLNINIPSFSAKPSGSIYYSDSVEFSGQ